MARKERFGKFVLLEELARSGLGTEYRAAKLGPSGLERIIDLIRVAPALATNADFGRALMEQGKLASQLKSPHIQRILAIGGPLGSYVAYEYLEGRSLRSVLARSRQESLPPAADQALLVISKVCSALEYAHGRKTEAGRRHVHGLLTPDAVVLLFDGEVRVRGFGIWAAGIRPAGGMLAEDALYLAPEQLAGEPPEPRSDVFSTGVLLFETLTGQPPEGADDVKALLERARLRAPTAEGDAIPTPIAEILERSLAPDPPARYQDMQAMRKAVDALLFSGPFSPTTFNLAFFLHSLFRDDIERETTAVKEEREASYADYLDSEPTPPPVPRAVAPAARPAPAAEAPPPAVTEPAPAPPEPPPVAPAVEVPRESVEPPPVMPPVAAPPPRRSSAAPVEPSFGQAAPRGGLPPAAWLGIVLAVAVAAGGGWYFLAGPGASQGPSVPPSTTLSAEAQAALARVRELEARLKSLEEEKQKAEAQAVEEAKKRVENQAAARGQKVDPAAVERAQAEARRKAQAEQEQRQLEERRRLEQERRAEETRLQEERKAEEARAAAAAAASTPPPVLEATPTPTPPPVVAATPAPTPTPTAAPSAAPLKPGTLVNLNDAGVIPPVIESRPPLRYPPIALQQRLEGTVVIDVLVDERGQVVDTKVTQPARGKLGLNEAAVEYAKRLRYRPATKGDVPVKVWVPLKVDFRLQG
jgi:TonB family protein